MLLKRGERPSTIRLFSFVLHEAPFGYAFTYNTAQGPSSRQAGTTAGWGDEKGKKPGFKPDAKVVGGIEISGAIEIRGLTAALRLLRLFFNGAQGPCSVQQRSQRSSISILSTGVNPRKSA